MVVYKCEECDFSTGNRHNFNRHQNTNKHKKKSAEKSDSEDELHFFDAKICNDRACSMQEYATKSDPCRFKCNKCKKSYSCISNLNRHFKKCDPSRNKRTTFGSVLDQPSGEKKLVRLEQMIQDLQKKIQNDPKKSMDQHNAPNALNASNTVLTCKFCEKKFSTKSNRRKHENRCRIDNNGFNWYDCESDVQEKYSSLVERNMNRMEKEVEYFKKMLFVTGDMASNSVRTLTHVVKNYDKAPPLEKITLEEVRRISNTENKSVKEYENKLIDEVFYHYNHKTLGKFIGDIIIKLYKKCNPADQSLWVTDTSRLTYLIKKTIDNSKPYECKKCSKTNNNECDKSCNKSRDTNTNININTDTGNDDSKWIVDKKGKETIEYLITPVVDKIAKLSKEFRDDNCPDPESEDYNYEELDHTRIMLINTVYNQMMMSIDDKKVHNEVLKYISSYFYLDKSKFGLIDEL